MAQTAKQRAASLRNLKKARAAQKKPKKGKKTTGGKKMADPEKKARRRKKGLMSVKKILGLDILNLVLTGQHIPDSLVYELTDGENTSMAGFLGREDVREAWPARTRYSEVPANFGKAIKENWKDPNFQKTVLAETLGYDIAKGMLKKMELQSTINALLKEFGLRL